MGTISSIGGPPVALVLQDRRPTVFRSTLAWSGFIGTVVGLSVLLIVGRFGVREFWLSLGLAPGMVIGVIIGFRVRSLAEVGQRTRYLVYALASFGAVWVLIRNL
jgi:uncharacterized membrane protein YfcA